MTEATKDEDMKGVTADTKDDDLAAELGGMIESETRAPFRDPVRGAGQTRIATLKYPWLHVVNAYQRRFPTNKEFFPYIENTEILERSETSTTLSETRRVSIDPGMPGWMKTLTRLHHFVFVEKSFIDYENKIMKLDTKMESLSTYATVTEDCVYKQHPDNSDWTFKEQTAYYKLHTWLFGVEQRIENYGSWIFTQRAKDALKQEKALIERVMQDNK